MSNNEGVNKFSGQMKTLPVVCADKAMQLHAITTKTKGNVTTTRNDDVEMTFENPPLLFPLNSIGRGQVDSETDSQSVPSDNAVDQEPDLLTDHDDVPVGADDLSPDPHRPMSQYTFKEILQLARDESHNLEVEKLALQSTSSDPSIVLAGKRESELNVPISHRKTRSQSKVLAYEPEIEARYNANKDDTILECSLPNDPDSNVDLDPSVNDWLLMRVPVQRRASATRRTIPNVISAKPETDSADLSKLSLIFDENESHDSVLLDTCDSDSPEWTELALPAPRETPPIGTSISMVITNVFDASHFIAQIEDGPDLVDQLSQAMRAEYEKRKQPMTYFPSSQQLAAVRWGNQWYRGFAIGAPSPDNLIQMIMVERGTTEYFDLNSVQPLDPKFATMPCQAVKCCLGGVAPIDTPVWPLIATEAFKKLVIGKSLKATIIAKEQDGDMGVVLVVDIPNIVGEKGVAEVLMEDHLAMPVAVTPMRTKKGEAVLQRIQNFWIGFRRSMTHYRGDKEHTSLQNEQPLTPISCKTSASVKSEEIDTKEPNSLVKSTSLKKIGNYGFGVPHKFTRVKITLLDRCGLCNKSIIASQNAQKCQECHIIYHKDCVPNVPPACVFGTDMTKETLGGKGLNMKRHTLQEWADLENTNVPLVVLALIKAIEEQGMNTQGLYRISGTAIDINTLQRNFYYGRPDLTDVDVHVCTGMLKKFFKELPDPLMTFGLHATFTKAVADKDPKGRRHKVMQTVRMLPRVHYEVLRVLVFHLHNIMNEPAIKMNTQNLAIIFGPTLMQAEDENSNLLHSGVHVSVINELLQWELDFWKPYEEEEGSPGTSSEDDVSNSLDYVPP